MYDFFRGTLIESSPSRAIVEVHGIGYHLSIPANLLPHLPKSGEEVLLYVSFIVRELSQSLYGFGTAQERDLFEVLINVSGIGPKTGIAMVGTLSFNALIDAITTKDMATICRVPGIGKKTAEKLIIEVHDKLPRMFDLTGRSDIRSQAGDAGPESAHTLRDAMSALINLGYNQSEAEKAILKATAGVKGDLDLPTLISSALKIL